MLQQMAAVPSISRVTWDPGLLGPLYLITPAPDQFHNAILAPWLLLFFYGCVRRHLLYICRQVSRSWSKMMLELPSHQLPYPSSICFPLNSWWSSVFLWAG